MSAPNSGVAQQAPKNTVADAGPSSAATGAPTTTATSAPVPAPTQSAPGALNKPAASMPATPAPGTAAASAGATPGTSFTQLQTAQVDIKNTNSTKVAAIEYLEEVRRRLSKNQDLYRQFLDTIKDFRSQRLTPPMTVDRVKQILQNHPDLIAKFAQFLPADAAITYDAREPVTQRKRLLEPLEDLIPPAVYKRVKTGAAAGDSVPLSERLGLTHSDRPDELKFVELLKERLPKPVYKEYLKLMTLFSNDVIDRRSFIEQSRPFFGRGPGAKELRTMLRALLKPRFKTRDFVMDSGLPAIQLAEVPPQTIAKDDEDEGEDKPFAPAGKPQIDLKNAKRNGHSYRKYPANFPIAKSSGRDLLCRSVLNDEWVSHPTFISEDANPQAAAIAGEASGAAHASHRNHFEEAMHKTEDERLEVDLGIEVNLALIKLLEPLERKIQGMTEQEKATFTLPAWSLGGRSRALPHVALMRIYGDTNTAREVLQGLSETPSEAVPLILARLKQKDEEWRSFKRQRNDNVWCPDDERNFPKALDYRGIAARAVDKKLISPKAFLQEVETHGEKAHYKFEFPDEGVFKDVRTMLEWYLLSGVADPAESGTVRSFIDGFVRSFFKLGPDFRPVAGSDGTDKSTTIFANENVFCFFRLFWTVYSRLEKVKDACKSVDGVRERNSTAISLGLQEVPQTPGAESESEAPKAAYEDLLALVRRLIEQTFAENNAARAVNDFEDACRKLMAIHGYPIYTADYLAQSLEKIIYTIAEDDSDSSTIFSLWNEWKTGLEPKALIIPEAPDVVMVEAGQQASAPQQQPAAADGTPAPEPPKWTEEGEYAERVKQICRDENCFRIEYAPDKRVLNIYILAKPQPKIPEKRSSGLGIPDEVDGHYLDTLDALKAVQQYEKEGQVLLKRNLRRCLMTPQEYPRKQRIGLVVSLSSDTGRMQYKRNSEDYFFRPAMPFNDANGRPLSIWQVDKAIRKKRNARFVRWLSDYELKSEYPYEADSELLELLTGTGKYQSASWLTRQELVINRAAALKYAVYRTYRHDHVPKGPARAFTIDDAEQHIVKLKKKVDPNAPPEPEEEFDDVDMVDAGPVSHGQGGRGHGGTPSKKKQAPVKSTSDGNEPPVRPKRVHSAAQKLARQPFRGLLSREPDAALHLRYIRKTEPPQKKQDATRMVWAKKHKGPACVPELRTKFVRAFHASRQKRNTVFIKKLSEIEKVRHEKLQTDTDREEWGLDQLLLGKGVYRVPGHFTEKMLFKDDNSGLFMPKYQVLHNAGKLPISLRRMARRRDWSQEDLKKPSKPYVAVAKRRSPFKSDTNKPLKYEAWQPWQPADVEAGAVVNLDETFNKWRVSRRALVDQRRKKNMRFILWMGEMMTKHNYAPTADDELDDLLFARKQFAIETPKGVWTTTAKFVTYEDAGLRLTYYTSQFEPHAAHPGAAPAKPQAQAQQAPGAASTSAPAKASSGSTPAAAQQAKATPSSAQGRSQTPGSGARK